MIKPQAFPVTAVQRFTTRDGPGIRTTVFFKGCSLKCLWCHNPEAMDSDSSLCFYPRRCVGCGECARACPKGLFRKGRGEHIFLEGCAQCSACARACPVSAIEPAAKCMTLREIVDLAARDKPFYGKDGGVTLSGGEPLLQMELPALLSSLHDAGLRTAIDTALYVAWPNVEAAIPYTSLFLVDVKAIDADTHRALTGAYNDLILDNIRKLARTSASIWIRTPVIPGYNAQELPAIARFARSLDRRDILIELIPYHDMAASKYEAMGKEAPLRDVAKPMPADIEKFYEAFEGLRRVRYNNKEEPYGGSLS